MPVGGPATYSFRADTTDDVDIASAVIEVTLPDGAEYVSHEVSLGDCSHSSGKVTCAIANIPSGQFVTLHVNVILTQPGMQEASAAFYGMVLDPLLENNTVTAVIEAEADPAPGVPSASWLGLVALAAGMFGLLYVRTRRKTGAAA